MRRTSRPFDEPNMSDNSLLIKVEDLISMGLGPDSQNLVNFKHVQTVLFMLARHLRMLKQQVEIRLFESEEEIIPEVKKSEKKMKKRKTSTLGSICKRDTDSYKRGKKQKDTDETDEDTDVARRGTRKKTIKGDEKQKRDPRMSLDKEKEVTARDIMLPTDKDMTSSDAERLPCDKKVKCKKNAEKKKKQRVKAGTSDSRIDYRDRKSRKAGRAHVGNVEVVTQAEFAGLEAAVRQLQQLASQPLGLTMPDNQTLREDMLLGTASLTEAMQTMQINARVQAAEQAIGRMAGLLTQLAAAGELPAEIAAALRDERLDLSAPGLQDLKQTLLVPPTHSPDAVTETTAPPESEHRRDPTAPVTLEEFEDIVTALKKQMTLEMQQITSKGNFAADNATKNVQFLSEKLEPVWGMAERINVLHLLVADYAEQLHGFDAGLSTQMQGFQEQMKLMRSDLRSGLEQMAAVNDNTEATALAELTARYEGMVVGLEDVNTTHQALYTVQSKLSDELRNLVESVEMLRDQKSDRDEVLDALRDKADVSRLKGLLTEDSFTEVRAELEKMLEICQDKFKKQDKTWIGALNDIQKELDTMAGQTDLISAQQDAETRLQDLHDLLQRLEGQLGDPIAALLMRRLGRGAMCGACGTNAFMDPGGPGRPPELPALPAARPRPSLPPPLADDTTQVCVTHPHVEDVKMPVRWCGGEHTIRSQLRQRALPLPRPTLATRPYIGVGFDGRAYFMEEEVQPCVESNELPESRKDVEGGAGDA